MMTPRTRAEPFFMRERTHTAYERGRGRGLHRRLVKLRRRGSLHFIYAALFFAFQYKEMHDSNMHRYLQLY